MIKYETIYFYLNVFGFYITLLLAFLFALKKIQSVSCQSLLIINYPYRIFTCQVPQNSTYNFYFCKIPYPYPHPPSHFLHPASGNRTFLPAETYVSRLENLRFRPTKRRKTGSVSPSVALSFQDHKASFPPSAPLPHLLRHVSAPAFSQLHFFPYFCTRFTVLFYEIQTISIRPRRYAYQLEKSNHPSHPGNAS